MTEGQKSRGTVPLRRYNQFLVGTVINCSMIITVLCNCFRSKATIADLTEDDIDLVSKKVLGEDKEVAKEGSKVVDPKRQEAIASLFHVRDRDKVRFVCLFINFYVNHKVHLFFLKKEFHKIFIIYRRLINTLKYLLHFVSNSGRSSIKNADSPRMAKRRLIAYSGDKASS
jgi:hypothetical protein